MKPSTALPAIGAAVTGWLAACLASVPDSIRQLATVTLVFIALDTIAGVVTATLCHVVSSHRMRERLLAKAAQYAILLALSGGAGALVRSWFVIESGLGAIIAIEAMSMLEHLAKLERCGGVNLGPAAPALKRLGQFLAAESERKKP